MFLEFWFLNQLGSLDPEYWDRKITKIKMEQGMNDFWIIIGKQMEEDD